MRYKPKSSAALHIALGGLPAQMPVNVDDYPDSVVRVTKVGVATRTSPKS
jgi:hypothetical protein